MFIFSGCVIKIFEGKASQNKKIVIIFSKDVEKYVNSQEEGVWILIPQINSDQYVIKLDGYDDEFSEEWQQKFQYDGFYIEILESLWISDIGSLLSFDKNEFVGESISSKTGDGNVRYSDFKYAVPSGKYLVTIKGYARKQLLDFPNANYGYLFSLTKVDEFDGYKNPREEQYDFNVAGMKQM